jgi:CheY-like chemotaxis protein
VVVDDDPDVLCTVRQILEKNGYKVYAFDNGREMLRHLNEGKKPSLIILDIMMPEMSGWQIHKKLQENHIWKDIPIVFLSSRANDVALDMYNRYGIEYISKPFDINDFKEGIEKAFNSRQYYIKQRRKCRYSS